MYSITKTKEKYISNIYEFTCDYLNDIEKLPIEKNKIRAGSTCICIEDSSVWILGHDYIWHKL